MLKSIEASFSHKTAFDSCIETGKPSGLRNSRNTRDSSPPPRNRSKDNTRNTRNSPSSLKKVRQDSNAPLEELKFQKALLEAAQSIELAPLVNETQTGTTLRLRTLQYMILSNLRRELASNIKRIYDTRTASESLMEEATETMAKYGEEILLIFSRSLFAKMFSVRAIQDLKYMLEKPSQDDAVSKLLQKWLYISNDTDEDRDIMFYDPAIMTDAGFTGLNKYRDMIEIPSFRGYGGYSDTKRNIAQKAEDFVGRLFMALFGGLSLIAPMLIMRLHPTLLTGLLTTSVFVVIVGVILAWFMTDAQKKDILGATAGYAAVLVVFVSTSS